MSLDFMSLGIVKKILIDPADNFPRNSRIVEILHLQDLPNVLIVVFNCCRVESIFCTSLITWFKLAYMASVVLIRISVFPSTTCIKLWRTPRASVKQNSVFFKICNMRVLTRTSG